MCSLNILTFDENPLRSWIFVIILIKKIVIFSALIFVLCSFSRKMKKLIFSEISNSNYLSLEPKDIKFDDILLIALLIGKFE